MAKKPPAKPIRVNFTDGAKRRANVPISSLETEVARITEERDQLRSFLQQRIQTLEDGIRLALAAHEEGRRGDCAKTLRRLLPQPPAGPKAPTPPPEPRRA